MARQLPISLERNNQLPFYTIKSAISFRNNRNKQFLYKLETGFYRSNLKLKKGFNLKRIDHIDLDHDKLKWYILENDGGGYYFITPEPVFSIYYEINDFYHDMQNTPEIIKYFSELLDIKITQAGNFTGFTHNYKIISDLGVPSSYGHNFKYLKFTRKTPGLKLKTLEPLIYLYNVFL